MDWIFVVYVILLAFLIWKASKKGSLSVLNPLVTLYFIFAPSCIYPLVTYEYSLPSNIVNVTHITCAVNIAFLLLYRKQFLQPISVKPDYSLMKYAGNRKIILWFFLGVIICSGLYTGVTQMLLTGADVEDYRMTSDVGMGFVKAIPSLGIPYLVMEYFILNRRMSFIKAGIIGLSIGFILFLATAARGGMLTYAMCFFIWVNLRYRGFRWYEYFGIFYLLKPVIATVLKAIRSASILDLVELQLFDNEKVIFGANTVRLAEYMNRTHDYLWGESYFYSIVRLIPRFLWPNKPVAIDYKYKEMVGLEFDGGGIYTFNDFDLFLNFGYYYVIVYVLWLFLVHWMYQKLINTNTKFANKMLLLLLLSSGFGIGGLIENIQIYFLFLLIFVLVNKKWRII